MKINRNYLINENNISKMNIEINDDYNVKRLLKNNNIGQSQSIKFGNIFQDFIKKIIVDAGGILINIHYADVNNTGNKSNKGKKDMDVLFIFNGKIYYFECKVNLNLDTEKIVATDEKIEKITNWLKIQYTEEIISGALTCWFEREKKMPIKLNSNVFFMKDLISILCIDCNSDEYYSLMEEFGKIL